MNHPSFATDVNPSHGDNLVQHHPIGHQDTRNATGIGLFSNRTGGEKPQPLPMDQILTDLKARTGGWPRRVGSALFVDESGELNWLDKMNSLFGWSQSACGAANWHTGKGFVSKGEFFERLRQTAKQYCAVESLPHQPPLAGHYYRDTPDLVEGDGSRFHELLHRFNPLTDSDHDLIRAAFMTPGWGGANGARPVFVVTSDDGRGSGKTKLCEFIGRLWDGIISFADREDISTIKKRLMSANTLQKRVCLLDNVKAHKFSWGDLEGLVTANIIDGYRNYVGDFERPNTLTWFLTLNGASLSKDMAQRAVIVKVKKPVYSATWADDTRRFIDQHRWEIIGDIMQILKQPADYKLDRFTRWGDWERDVLQRLPEPGEAQKVILERQGDADVDAEEGGLIGQEFGERLASLGYNIEADQVFIPVSVAVRWYNEAMNTREKTNKVSRHLSQMSQEGELPQLVKNNTNSRGRGFVWQGEKADACVPVRCDIDERIQRDRRAIQDG